MLTDGLSLYHSNSPHGLFNIKYRRRNFFLLSSSSISKKPHNLPNLSLKAIFETNSVDHKSTSFQVYNTVDIYILQLLQKLLS